MSKKKTIPGRADIPELMPKPVRAGAIIGGGELLSMPDSESIETSTEAMALRLASTTELNECRIISSFKKKEYAASLQIFRYVHEALQTKSTSDTAAIQHIANPEVLANIGYIFARGLGDLKRPDFNLAIACYQQIILHI